MVMQGLQCKFLSSQVYGGCALLPDKVVASTGPGAPNPYMPPPVPNTGQQPQIPQNFAPTGRKKALICACNYRYPLANAWYP